ncbi:5769_t:CDS:2, partial [Rhizophagus irregularis]
NITVCAATNCIKDPIPIRGAEMMPTDGEVEWSLTQVKTITLPHNSQSVMGDCCQMVHKCPIASWYPGGPSGL